MKQMPTTAKIAGIPSKLVNSALMGHAHDQVPWRKLWIAETAAKLNTLQVIADINLIKKWKPKGKLLNPDNWGIFGEMVAWLLHSLVSIGVS